jgi:hypothetical protein
VVDYIENPKRNNIPKKENPQMEVHDCEYKQGKIIDIEVDSDGGIRCRGCNKEVSPLALHTRAQQSIKKLALRKNHGKKNTE